MLDRHWRPSTLNAGLVTSRMIRKQCKAACSLVTNEHALIHVAPYIPSFPWTVGSKCIVEESIKGGGVHCEHSQEQSWSGGRDVGLLYSIEAPSAESSFSQGKRQTMTRLTM